MDTCFHTCPVIVATMQWRAVIAPFLNTKTRFDLCKLHAPFKTGDWHLNNSSNKNAWLRDGGKFKRKKRTRINCCCINLLRCFKSCSWNQLIIIWILMAFYIALMAPTLWVWGQLPSGFPAQANYPLYNNISKISLANKIAIIVVDRNSFHMNLICEM